MERKSEPDEPTVAQYLSTAIQAQQLRPGVNDVQSGDTEQRFRIAKSYSDKLTPEDQARLIQHLEQHLEEQFTPGMMSPDMPGLDKYPALFAWYLERCLKRRVNSICNEVQRNEGIEVDSLRLLGERQALIFALLLRVYQIKGALTDEEVHRVLILAYGLLPVVSRAHDGDQFAQKQLKAIQKLIYAERYGFQESDIEKILDHKHTFSNPVARGMEISQLRTKISWLVDRKDGAHFVPANNDLIRLSDNPAVTSNKNLAEKIKGHLGRLSKRTLDEVTISIYSESIEDDSGNSRVPKKLKEDLRAYEKWRNQTTPPHTPGRRYDCDLPTEEYTQGWRELKPGSGGKREVLKKRKPKTQKF